MSSWPRSLREFTRYTYIGPRFSSFFVVQALAAVCGNRSVQCFQQTNYGCNCYTMASPYSFKDATTLWAFPNLALIFFLYVASAMIQGIDVSILIQYENRWLNNVFFQFNGVLRLCTFVREQKPHFMYLCAPSAVQPINNNKFHRWRWCNNCSLPRSK